MKKSRKLKNVFLSSIYQNAGKTTISLGLFQLFRERSLRTVFMKPVGQKYVKVGNFKVDKDSYLFQEVFRCCQLRSSGALKFMNPITVGKGFTEEYIFNPRPELLKRRIEESFRKLTRNKDAIIVEGTGHSGVGSVIDFSNADVASILSSKVIIISEGGIGKSIDEISLNKALYDVRNVDILGVIVNKVLPEKFDRVKRVLEKGLRRKGIPLLGMIPHLPLLSSPTAGQIRDRMSLELLCGGQSLRNRVKHVIVAAMEPHNMIHHLQDGTLVLASGDRVDNILLAVSSHLVRDGRSFKIAGMILTGGLMPNREIIELLKRSEIPVMITDDDTYTVAAKVENLICKIDKTDKDKIEESARLVKKYVDVDRILNAC